MRGADVQALPGTPPPLLRAVVDDMDPETKAIAIAHLTGGTSAEWLALAFTEYGYRVGATTIKTYRRSLNP